jgi:hypothetical protein
MPRTYFFFSSNEGKNWESTQLPIYDLVVDMDIGFDDFIYFATISEGVFRLKSPVVGFQDESKNVQPMEFFLYQNYPNPFNPTTRIQYHISSNSHVFLKVYDVLGNEVETLVDEYKPAGSYEVEFDANRLTSGVYFYQLKVGEYIQTKKMVLLK